LLLGLKNTTSDRGRREPQLGPGKKTFSRGPFGEERLEFLTFKTAHSGVLYIFEPRRGEGKRRRAGVTTPTPPPLSSGLAVADVLAVRNGKPPLRLSGPDRREFNGLLIPRRGLQRGTQLKKVKCAEC